jgi:hypothetical protein
MCPFVEKQCCEFVEYSRELTSQEAYALLGLPSDYFKLVCAWAPLIKCNARHDTNTIISLCIAKATDANIQCRLMISTMISTMMSARAGVIKDAVYRPV